MADGTVLIAFVAAHEEENGKAGEHDREHETDDDADKSCRS